MSWVVYDAAFLAWDVAFLVFDLVHRFYSAALAMLLGAAAMGWFLRRDLERAA